MDANTLAIVIGMWIMPQPPPLADPQPADIVFKGRVSYSLYTYSAGPNHIWVSCRTRAGDDSIYTWVSEDSEAGFAIPDVIATRGYCRIIAEDSSTAAYAICGCMQMGECHCEN